MRTAVVTGAAGAIGTAVCTRLNTRGYHVIAVDLDSGGLDRLPDPVTRLPIDLTEPDFHEPIAAAVGDRCDLLVNNAGMVVTKPFEEVTARESRREQLVNLQAPMQLSRTLYPALRTARGRIVSVVSLGAMLPLAESAGYSASKAGLRAFMLAMAMLERETGVGVSMVHPAAVDTPMLRHEVTHGGSALNFLGDPLSADTVAAAVVANLDRPPPGNLPAPARRMAAQGGRPDTRSAAPHPPSPRTTRPAGPTEVPAATPAVK
jgi:NAD(P)-dependent dehydrogenase (short-subunit alcohol dehydrogenase family)